MEPDLFKQISHTLDVSGVSGRAQVLSQEVGGQAWIVHFNPRAHRKHRHHALFLNNEQQHSPRIIQHWFTMEWNNISWWVAFMFTIGSLVWLINACLCMWPLSSPLLQNQLTAWTAFVGGFIFIFGGYAALLEVFNRSKHITIEIHPASTKTSPAYHAISYKESQQLTWMRFEPRQWAWWMNMIQMIGALIFFMSCATGAIALYLPQIPMLNWYWMPQMIGAVCFIIASIMAMLEVQIKCTRPNIHDIGWYAGFFNLVGAIGFFLCAWFGAYTQSTTDLYWGSDFSTFWGAIGFLIASYLMWYEAINHVTPSKSA